MKRSIILCFAVWMTAVANTFACTNLIVGKMRPLMVRPLFPIQPTRMAYSENFIIIRLLPIQKVRC